MGKSDIDKNFHGHDGFGLSGQSFRNRDIARDAGVLHEAAEGLAKVLPLRRCESRHHRVKQTVQLGGHRLRGIAAFAIDEQSAVECYDRWRANRRIPFFAKLDQENRRLGRLRNVRIFLDAPGCGLERGRPADECEKRSVDGLAGELRLAHERLSATIFRMVSVRLSCCSASDARR